MKAQEYLKARGVEVTRLENASVGRLSVDAEFRFAGKRGVIVSPRRGTVSDRYLALLSAEDVSYIVVESDSALSFYESPQKGKELIPVRALRPSKSKWFPSQELFKHLTALLRQSVKRRESTNVVVSNLLMARIADEKSSKDDEWICSVVGIVDECSTLISRVAGKLKCADINAEGVLRLCAVLAGFRMTPSNPEESAQLIDWIARVSDDKKYIHGLPLVLSPVFKAIGENAGATILVTSAVGAQFSVLSSAKSDEVVLENGSQELLSLLQVLYPEITIHNDGYLENNSVRQKDAVILVPPLGKSMQLKKESTIVSSFCKGDPDSKKYPAEYLYAFKAIEQCQANGIITIVLPEGILSGASHKAFRNWLLDVVQILGVVSLPAGFCFTGTSIRCSVLFLKKTEPLPSDYPISMIELRPEDFESDDIPETIEKVKAVFNPEDHV